MSARAYNIMRELPAIFGTVTGIDAANVEIGYRNPATISEGDLPTVLVYDPSTADPEPSVFGLRSEEFAFIVAVVNVINTDEATLQLCEEMATALNAATLTNADTAVMNPGSIIIDQKRQRSVVVAFMTARWEGL